LALRDAGEPPLRLRSGLDWAVSNFGCQMQELCVLGSPRTGTNHIAKLLANSKKIKSRTEIFHPAGAYGLLDKEVNRLADLANVRFTGSLDPHLVSYARTHPASLLDILDDPAQGHILMSFKIFPGHIPLDLFRTALLPRTNIHFVFVQRRPLDIYISDVKANLIGKYHNVDTTGIQVRLDAQAFIEKTQFFRNWYLEMGKEISGTGKKYGIINYEDHINCPIEQSYMHIRDEAVEAGVDPLAFAPVPKVLVGLPRQDLAASYAEKITNEKEFMHELKERGKTDIAFKRFLPTPID
jgi:hypothetical protein